MKERNLLVIDSSVLPDVFYKVAQLNKLLKTGEIRDIKEGLDLIGIGRSTYYKYKDFVFEYIVDVNKKIV